MAVRMRAAWTSLYAIRGDGGTRAPAFLILADRTGAGRPVGGHGWHGASNRLWATSVPRDGGAASPSRAQTCVPTDNFRVISSSADTRRPTGADARKTSPRAFCGLPRDTAI